MTGREQLEYKALRATIGQRGTARIWIFVVGLASWATLEVATIALSLPPVESLIPLIVLAATSEAVFALHVGVERIGRYLQVFHEAGHPGAESASWEHVAMSFGRPAGAARVDPLFTVLFAIAGAFNLLPATLVGPTREELLFVGGAHALFLVRLAMARGAAGRQRAIDLARFEQLKSAAPPPSRSTAN